LRKFPDWMALAMAEVAFGTVADSFVITWCRVPRL
jgi:hypothetical protein